MLVPTTITRLTPDELPGWLLGISVSWEASGSHVFVCLLLAVIVEDETLHAVQDVTKWNASRLNAICRDSKSS